MWNIESWDGVRRFFPDNKNGSRIVVTTRLSNLASQFNYSSGLDLKFLDKYASWDLFCKTVFGEEACPLELEDVGKKIVEGCKGLPLSVAVIGGLLSKSERTKESWGLFEKNISSIVNLDKDESCLQVLYMSYNNLPIHLKPCFLFMGKYFEDEVISNNEFILSSIAEGFVKLINGKSVEEAAEEYVEELIDRNMLIVETRYYGKLISFKMHDLLRDICLREAKKLKFLWVLEERSIPEDINSQRRVIGRSSVREYPTPLLQSLESVPLLRTLYVDYIKSLSYSFRLLRVVILKKYSEEEDSHDYYEEILRGLVNLRILAIDVKELPLPSSVYFFWNLQTLILDNVGMDFVCEIWKMPQLRFVVTLEGRLDGAYCLPDSFTDKEDMVLKNLDTLLTVSNLKFGEGVLKRIPNIKQLGLCYERKVNTLGEDSSEEEDNYYHLNNVCFLHKLEHLQLRCSSQHTHIIRQVSFPHSLKILILEKTYLPWEDMKTKIGVLPHLQVLELHEDSFVGSEWETEEDQFSNLKFLMIELCDVECWITDSTHFPRLEHLHLCYLPRLREIPSCIGDIPTLHSIKVEDYSDSVVDSVKIIKEEQHELGNEDLDIIIRR
ncbi:putative late blight resistance protein homolog R1B-16 [Salvia hispanica]|uniref:putative late blight resistance protein homolog R1B-16 n=1 Tax=Salvia hispanica TaxID=49212 RepID=UPI0020098D03|nr:putative late blight resistance protein homolog R1B-16 [Salvia hispanica]XP_047959698.1 putative late blight resistance protein homolog R1B-16 [Salvia hispanica]